ncbi:MAG: hypothetical protein K0R17_2005 [Rariglobus sp.]|nr:hypothetical protein [Rariglobus sp.]
MPLPRHFPEGRRSGFALLITITLLAFLVLLLVSLASLTRVETQVASNTQQLSHARQNALMALNIALGKLQTAAGPDQRVTATAEFDSAAVTTNRRWTGVWDSNPASATHRQRLTWLVSGATPNAAAAVPDPGPTGVSATAVRLVGVNSADLSSLAASDANRVDVPLQEIRSDAISGLASVNGGHLVGRFGYWVGDEGVKAKVSVSDPWKNTATLSATGTAPTEAQTFSFFGLQRTGIEGVSSVGANAATVDKIGAAYPAATDLTFLARLPRVLSLHQLPLANASGEVTLAAATKTRFHDLTASSRSVLADVTAGGLKRDLTAWAAMPEGPGNLPRDTDYVLPPSYTPPSDSTERYGLPKWGIIRSYAGMQADGTVKAAVPQTDEEQGLYPLATHGSLGIAMSCEGAGQPAKLHFFPHLVLWNPTNVPIGGSYEFCFGFTGNIQAFFKRGSTDAAAPVQLRANMSEISTTDRVAPPSRYLPTAYFRFRVETPAGGIAPGQSLAFTLSRDGHHPYVPADPNNVMRANDPIAPDNSVTIDGPTVSAAELTQTIHLLTRYGEYGEMSMLLCPLPDPSNPNPTPAESLASAYQGSRIANGFGAPGATPDASTPQPADTVLIPTLRYVVGLRGSRRKNGTNETPRWLANLNPRAEEFSRRRSHYTITTATITYVAVPNVLGNENSAVQADDPRVIDNTVVRSTLFEFQPPGVPLFSLAQLQHASLSLLPVNPAYAVGNSVADYYTPLDQTSIYVGPDSANPDSIRRIYDLSFLLNQTLWDRYFFSTVPTSLTSAGQLTADYRLPNSRHALHWRSDPVAEFAELKTTTGAAAHLLVDGGFNVNSTSVQAWRALLYSHNTDTAQPVAAAFSRFARPGSGATANSPWHGWRVLTEPQLDTLAANIVQQVKARGPFLSLADFVNRSLVDNPDTTEDERFKGTLQAALDAPVNDNVNAVFPFRVSDSSSNSNGFTYRINNYPTGSTDAQKERYRGGPDTSGIYSTMAAFIPGFLSQADLLNALGPVLTARSDTFRIRAYGDVINPATGSATPEARAWCEAIVQRLPEYTDPTNLPAVAPGSATATNQTFGRRFKIVSFQWLSADDI